MVQTTCQMCGGFTIPFWKRARIFGCRSCGLLSLCELPSQGHLSDYYERIWKSPIENAEGKGGTDRRLAQLFADCLARTLNLENFRGLRLMEFGAGRGHMMAALNDAGAEIYGVDLYSSAELKCLGLKAFRDFADLPVGISFDGIVCMEVIEHLSEPWVIFERLKNLLRPGGWILITTPNAKGLNAWLTRSNWREFKNPGHLFFFTPKSLDKFLRRCGYSNPQRLKWRINYGTRLTTRLSNAILQNLRLDGGLKYLAYRQR